MEATIILAQSALDREQAQDLRRSVLCGELHWPREVVDDGADSGSMLALASVGPKPVGTARLLKRQELWQIDALAVLERFRRQGVGKALLAELERQARGQGASLIRVLAPPEASAYFEKAGYQAKDGPVLEKWIG